MASWRFAPLPIPPGGPLGCQKPPNPSKSNITGAPIPICPYQPPGSALRCVQPISATRGLSCAHLPKSARPSRPIYPHHPPLGALGFIYPNLPPGALGGLSIQIGHQGASGANVPEWATRGFSGLMCPKWPPGVLRGISIQISRQGVLRGLSIKIGHQGRSGDYQPNLATRGHSRAYIPKSPQISP